MLVRKWLLVAVVVACLPLCAVAAEQEDLYLGMPTSFWFKHLTKGNPKQRQEAVAALKAIGVDDEKVVSAFVKALKDDETEVRFAALAAIQSLGPKAKSAIPHLLPLLRDKDGGFRTSAIRTLGSIRSTDKKVVRALIEQLADIKGLERPVGNTAPSEALVALDQAGSAAMKTALPTLVRLIEAREVKKNEEWRETLISFLPAAGADAIPHLLAILKEPSVQIQTTAAAALKEFGPQAKAAIPDLIAILKKKSWVDTLGAESLRGESARDALAAMGAEAAPALVEALADKNARFWACQALKKIGPKAVPALRKALKHPKVEVTAAAAEALETILKEAK
jgi:HEAT repeat protein